MTLQDLIFKLSEYWSAQGCLIQQPLDLEVGRRHHVARDVPARAGPDPLERRLRPAVAPPGRRTLRREPESPLQAPPVPGDPQAGAGRGPAPLPAEPRGVRHQHRAHDIRFEEDNWESPTLGAWGIGWQVLFDGLEITQFTYFQQAGGQELSPISAELTYGLERLAMVLQKVDNVYDLEWAPGVPYRDVRFRDEVEQSKFAFGEVPGMAPGVFAAFHRDLFDRHFEFSKTLIEARAGHPRARAVPQVLARLQRARRQRRRRRHRTHRLHPARPPAGRGHRQGLRRVHVARPGHPWIVNCCSRSVVRKSRPAGCCRCRVSSASGSPPSS